MEDAAKDNVIYLEIRTSPRSLPDGTSSLEYVTSLKTWIMEYNAKAATGLLVKLVLSVDRSQGLSKAFETMRIIEEVGLFDPQTHDQVIVGLDFSGNPLGGRFEDFVSVFHRARELGLKTAIHCGEVQQLSTTSADGSPSEGLDTDETSFILAFKYVY
jgi:adenosine deaminase